MSKNSDKKQISKEADLLLEDMHRNIVNTLGNDFLPPRKDTYYNGLAYSVRERLMARWLKTQRAYYTQESKRVYYLSMEFLPGRFLMNYVTNMQLGDQVKEAIGHTDFSLEQLEDEEWDAGLGNGGLGRLASCFMDSLATLKIPAYGYGIRYDYGIFYQTIENGYQVEHCDNWIRQGNPWEFARRGFLYNVNFYGRSEAYTDEKGALRYRWIDTEKIKAMACDILIPGYGSDNVNNMRLWAAVSSEDFNLGQFNKGDYTGAMEAKVLSENISKVLYPSDEKEEGKELRLKQQYFLVAATFQDIMRRFKRHNSDFSLFPKQIAVQLNDTHPTIAIPEFMRLLVDEEGLDWDYAWSICNKTFAYTNHTVLPEALETWSVNLLSRLLPRHMQIIYDINDRFMKEVIGKFPGRLDLMNKMSIIDDGFPKKVRMAHLAIVGSHAVNGVAMLHSNILKEHLFKEFDACFPGRLTNVTNGVTPRRWILQANPRLSELITSRIGDGWITDLDQLKKLIPLAEDASFRAAWRDVKKENKERLKDYVSRKIGVEIDTDMLFDVHSKRMHEYKRQLLNVLHAITLYTRLKDNPELDMAPRTIMFAGKAAPAYHLAKLIIKLINSVGDVINNDESVNKKLKVLFLPNYCISQAEKVIPATDLSEQISTAGLEASGTGNMKFAMNGALTIGTLDGANVEMMEEVGEENIFIFGLKAHEVVSLKEKGYNPYEYLHKDEELRRILDLIDSNHFCQNEPGLFKPIMHTLLEGGDKYLVLADYRNYVDTQREVGQLYRNKEEWTRKSILNTANMGKFSSDRSIKEYAERIWDVTPLDL
jgi:glycogen phosphorylase